MKADFSTSVYNNNYSIKTYNIPSHAFTMTSNDTPIFPFNPFPAMTGGFNPRESEAYKNIFNI